MAVTQSIEPNVNRNFSDPLEWLLNHYPFDAGKINSVIHGEKYLAVCLNDGRMGVCATLNQHPADNYSGITTIDITTIHHRILALAYYSAILNNETQSNFTGDIFDFPWPLENKKIVMVGFFKPLVQKFDRAGIPLFIFDLVEIDKRLLPTETLKQHLADADIAIITSTTVVNNTFPDIIRSLHNRTKAVLLGPSSILHPFWFSEYPVQAVFGMQFKPCDSTVIQLIAAGEGTPAFAPYATKTALVTNDLTLHSLKYLQP